MKVPPIDVVVVGSGPNGLAAAIASIREGRSVLLLEGEDTVGGGARSAELTLPGFVHDVCSAIHPMAVASPFFKTLPLGEHGLTWIHPPLPLAHPLDDGTAAVLERSVDATADAFGPDVRQKTKEVPPAPRNDAAAFIRGAYLDLAGCIPSLTDVRDFLNDPRPDKRRVWVDALLAGQKPAGKPDAYRRHLATVLRTWVLSRTNSDDSAALSRPVEEWLGERLKAGARYDQIVREMITTSPAVYGRIRPLAPTPNLFYKANEFKPENLAASTSRLFLGVTPEWRSVPRRPVRRGLEAGAVLVPGCLLRGH